MKIGVYERNAAMATGNIGLSAIVGILRSSGGHTVERCGIDGVCQYPVVLAPVTSAIGMLALYEKAGVAWRHRKAAVILGGPGCINVLPMRWSADYAAFGRAENYILPLVDAAAHRAPFAGPHVLNLPAIYPVSVAQPERLFDETCVELDWGSNQLALPWGTTSARVRTWHEDVVGCPNKCAFCQYAFTRKHLKRVGGYVQNTASNGLSTEVLLSEPDKALTHRRVITAIDGSSERMRVLYGKGYSRSLVVRALSDIVNNGKANIIKLYNVGNFPSERQDDRDELRASMLEVAGKVSRKCTIVVHTTPFKAQPLTPMQWSPMTLRPSWRFEKTDRLIADNGTCRVVHDLYNEGPNAHLRWAVADRFSEDMRGAVDASALDDIAAACLRERDISQPLPTDYLSSFTPRRVLASMAGRLSAAA